MITLGRNKPILVRDLNIKNLLIEAFPGRLMTILPVVCKILESMKESIIFKEFNPWVKPILGILEELKNKSDLRLNLKCEI